MSNSLSERMNTIPERRGKVQEGFTLVELLIVIAIIGILAGIAVPLFLGERTKAMQKEALTNIQALRLLEEQYFAENGCYYREGNPLVCTNKSPLTTTTLPDGTVSFAFLPGFKPGQDTSLRFTYKLTIAGIPSASTFTATATGKNGTPVYGSIFCIDQNNSVRGGTDCP